MECRQGVLSESWSGDDAPREISLNAQQSLIQSDAMGHGSHRAYEPRLPLHAKWKYSAKWGNLMRSQGRALRVDEVQRILTLLQDTELSLAAIAERMQCSRGTISAINRKYSIRHYAGRRTVWQTLRIDLSGVARSPEGRIR
jgi:hypothetical protein